MCSNADMQRHEMPVTRLLFVVVFWAALVFAFTMAISPHPPPLLGTMWDKAQHALAFAVLTALALLAYPRVRPLWIGLMLSAVGALIEVVQAIPSLHRDSDYHDWIADTVAILIVLSLRVIVARLLPKS